MIIMESKRIDVSGTPGKRCVPERVSGEGRVLSSKIMVGELDNRARTGSKPDRASVGVLGEGPTPTAKK